MGAFCGKFKDDHESTEEDDDDDDDEERQEKERDLKDLKDIYKPKDHWKIKKHERGEKKAMKLVKRFGSKVTKAAAAGGAAGGAAAPKIDIGGGGKLFWTKYLSPIQVEVKTKEGSSSVEFLKLKAVKDRFTLAKLEYIAQINKIHTLELVRCHLDDIPPNLSDLDSTLSVVRMSHNNIESINPDLTKCTGLERIQFDWNYLRAIDPGVMSECFEKLLVIDLSHNQLSILPNDFGLGLNELKSINVSYNELGALPDSILSCKSLQVLILSHNKLHRLPADLGRLRDLRKLFASFNLLHSLPDTIGQCRNLEKIRVVSNYIRNMPLTIIQLWKKEGGRLDEFLVDRNPLVHPSITAFEMGGLEQAMKLFKEYAQDIQLQQVSRLADEEKGSVDGGGSERKGGAPPLPANGEASGLSLPEISVLEPEMVAIADANEVADMAEALATEIGEKKHTDLGANEYYFGHLKDKPGMQKQINNIRSAESTLLLLKKSHFVESQKKLAVQKDEESKKPGGAAMPKFLHQFLDPDFNVTQYHSMVRVSDLDLYFNLLVFSTKPIKKTCHLLFDQFQTAPNHVLFEDTEDEQLYMDRGEWNNFLARVDVKLPESIQGEMWKLLAWRDETRLEERDFIAGWHIHDVEHRDPWIERVAKGLKLDYYDMNVEEMTVRVKAKSAEDADPTLSFDASDSDDDGDENVGPNGELMPSKAEKPETVLEIDLIEGERRLARPKAKVAKAGKAETPAAAAPNDGKVQISLSEQEYSAIQALIQAEESGAEDEEVEMNSSDLSEETGESESDFDAFEHVMPEDGSEQDYPVEEATEAVDEGRKKRRDDSKKKLVIDSDDAIRQLMTLPPEDILTTDKDARRAQLMKDKALADKEGKQKKKKKKAKQKASVNDPRFKTDVFPVRQILRQVYRNLPHDDFVKLVNFLLRGMRFMKHSPPDRPSYWHSDEPTFKHTMGERGTNPYTRSLLAHMGFVCVNDLFWVWPALHLKQKKDSSKTVETWGDKVVPPHCPGKHKDRMEDMILLFRSCQRALNTRTDEFRGHFK